MSPSGHLAHDAMTAQIRALVARQIRAADQRALRQETARLRDVLERQDGRSQPRRSQPQVRLAKARPAPPRKPRARRAPRMPTRPLVSCVLPTRDRRRFLSQALRYFERRTYDEKELVVVDDSVEPMADLLPDDQRVRYIRLEEPVPLGAKLNLGIEAARGDVLQKLDDDDYYHPDFLATTVGALRGADPRRSMVGLDSFLVFLAGDEKLTSSGPGWFAGGTLCFHRQLWKQRPFRDVPRAVDWWFLKDHRPRRVRIRDSELFMLVRHGFGHTWKRMGKADVNTYFLGRPAYGKSLAELLPPEDVDFYRGIRAS